MKHNFLSINTNYNDFSSRPSAKINKFLLKNNEIILGKVYGFLQKSEDILLINGFLGTGKKQLVTHLLEHINKDVLSLVINCTEATTLDDILLSLWAQFIDNHRNINIAYKHQQTKSFHEKLTNCLNDSQENIIVTFYDFELINENNLNDIQNFIWTISKDEKLKTIITSKTFNIVELPEDITYSKVTLKAFSRESFEDYIMDKGIKASPIIFDELYKITRGYYYFAKISVNILLKKNLSISDYLVAYTNSGMSFDKFLAKAFISMLPQECMDVLQIFAVIRHQINSQILDYIDSFNKYAIDYLCDNNIIRVSNNMYIINNYYKSTILDEINEETKLKLHKIAIELYSTQLPYKPSERLMLISRTTLRKELEYHTSIVFPQINNETQQVSEPTIEHINLTTEELKIKAESLFEEYKYQESLNLYFKIIEDEGIDKYEIYNKVANIQQILGNTKYALYYYNLYLSKQSDDNNFNEYYQTKFNIAQVQYQAYKTSDAINTLYEIIEKDQNINLKIKAHILLGNIYISISEKDRAYNLYKNAIKISEGEDNLENLSELFFKFAILSDENNDEKNAIHYYNKCIESATNNNKYKSLSFSNLGEYYIDTNDINLACENFQNALELDISNNNYYGIYYTSANMAKLVKDKDKKQKYLDTSKKASLKTEDLFAMANSGLDLGDFFTNNNEPQKALKEYLSVLSLVENKFSNDNIKKIKLRIEDIKYKLGEEKFNELSKNSN